MSFKMTKIAAALAMAVAANGAYAATVTSMTIADTINSGIEAPGIPIHNAGDVGALCNAACQANIGSVDGVGQDGVSGAFAFAPSIFNLNTYQGGVNFWYGDLGTPVGAINMAGGAPLDFSTGFLFTGAAFQPFNSAAITASITGANYGATNQAAALSVNIAGWAGFYTANGFTFNLTPDATPVIDDLFYTGQVAGNDTWAYRLHFAHDITTADDPSGTYVNFTAQWALEGTMTTAVPEASTYGMMLSGLGLVGAVVARRRRTAK